MLIPFSELFRRHGIRPAGVLHVGAHEGQEAEEYNKLGIPRVIWVEANPETFQKLNEHVGPMKGHLPMLACISDRDGQEVHFNVASNQGQSSSILPFGTHAIAHPNVRFVGKIRMVTSRLDTILEQNHIQFTDGWFLNIDLQGAELLALRGLGKLISHFNWAYIEVNEEHLYQGCPLVGEIDWFLALKGFTGADVKMTNWKWGDKLYIRCSQP